MSLKDKIDDIELQSIWKFRIWEIGSMRNMPNIENEKIGSPRNIPNIQNPS